MAILSRSKVGALYHRHDLLPPAISLYELLGTRLDVADVITTIKQNDNSVAEAAEYLEVPIEQINACLRYYADYKDEIDAWIARWRSPSASS